LHIVAGIASDIAGFVMPGVRVALLIPGVTTLQSWLRALLMKGEATKSIYQAMAINLIVTAVVLIAGIVLEAPGIEMAAIALTVAMLVELAYLGWRTRPVVARLAAVG
jgi:hypothetical protein